MQQRVLEHEEHDKAVKKPLHTGLVPDVLTLSCLWIQLGQDKRVKLTLRASPSLYSNSQRSAGITFSGLARKKKIKVIPLTIGAWNVRTLVYSAGLDRPQPRTALAGRELDRYKVEIAALSEPRPAEEVLLKEVGAGYTFFWI